MAVVVSSNSSLMEIIPEEIMYEIFQVADFQTLKECHIVCRKWCRIATQFLFRRVVFNGKNPIQFNEILARKYLSKFVKVISIEQGDMTVMDMLSSIVGHPALRQLLGRSTVGVISQHRPNNFITILSDMTGLQKPFSLLPVLEEIQLITNEEPYFPTGLFYNIQKLQIDMETIQLPNNLRWPLVDLRLRGVLDIESLEAFLKKHKYIRQLHIAIVSQFRPYGPSVLSDSFCEMLGSILGSRLDAGLARSIIDLAKESKPDHERSLLRAIYNQLGKIVDEKTANDMQQIIVKAFQNLLEYEFDRYSADIGNIGMSLEDSSQLEELNCSIEYFWEDDLVIKNMKMLDASKSGLWMNDEFREPLRICRVYPRRSANSP